MSDSNEDDQQLQVEPHARPLLTVEEQIVHMKAKGIAFELCTEEEAAVHLRTKCQFFHIYAYRKLFDKHVGGDRDGQYVGLDFGHLRALSRMDSELRDVLLPMTLDVEHFAKVRLLAAAEDYGEDGYAIMRAYWDSLPDDQRNFVKRELDRREGDPYASDVVRKYRNDMPLWVFSEVVSFGAFQRLMRFCGMRWGDTEILRLHYLQKWVQSVRNFSAHGACALNDLSQPPVGKWRAPDELTRVLASFGISKRLRSKHLRSPRMAQICTLIHLYAQVAPKGKTRSKREAALAALFLNLDGLCGILPEQNPAVASLEFIRRLTVGEGLLH
ncbi:Abi family protein [Collinsella intestinalis]|uniref:Abi family protein n=1 Tax=Collinsella intestinalis TaxID=147207 RepID=UPI00195C4C71|nr:Abi family protein [Collinsella intestinalis]MBM6942620.1 Abi family protein [Collinsella intestinalis]